MLNYTLFQKQQQFISKRNYVSYSYNRKLSSQDKIHQRVYFYSKIISETVISV